MGEQPTPKETQLAQERIDNLKSELTRKRTVSIVLTAIFSMLGFLVFVTGMPLLTFCSLVVALMSLLRYFDANGHLHEVRRRSTKTLFPRLSLLQSETTDKSTKKPAVQN